MSHHPELTRTHLSGSPLPNFPSYHQFSTSHAVLSLLTATTQHNQGMPSLGGNDYSSLDDRNVLEDEQRLLGSGEEHPSWDNTANGEIVNGFANERESKEMKKRRWWREAIVNSLFIASWYVTLHVLDLLSVLILATLGLLLLLCSQCTINGCSLPSITTSPSLFSSLPCTCWCNSSSPGLYVQYGLGHSTRQEDRPLRSMRE